MSWWESCRSFSLDWRHWLVKCVVTELFTMMWNPFPNVHLYIPCYGFPGGSRGKESALNEGDLGLISGLRRFSGKGKGYPLQYSCLENSMDIGSWWATVCGVTKSWTFSLSAMLKVCWFLFFFTNLHIIRLTICQCQLNDYKLPTILIYIFQITIKTEYLLICNIYSWGTANIKDLYLAICWKKKKKRL